MKMDKVWVENPFMKIAGFEALLLGVVAVTCCSLFSVYSGVHMNGFIHIMLSSDAPYWFYFLEQLGHGTLLMSFLYFIGLINTSSRIRFLDVAGTSLLARIPLLVPPLIDALPLSYSFMSSLLYATIIQFSFMVASILSVYYLWKAYQISCNPIKGWKSTLSFLIALILAEVLMKTLYLIV